jgi:hypothetical protein
MSLPGTALATLREPSHEQASRWHKARKDPPAARLRLLRDFFLEEPTARLLRRTDIATEMLVDTGTGTSARVTFGQDAIDVRVGPSLVQGDQPPVPRDVILDEISGIVEVLQAGSGFYVYTEELIGFDPIGACPTCDVEVFEWQTTCTVCDASVLLPRAGEDDHDARARRVVDVMLRRGMIELVSPRGRRNVEQVVSIFCDHGAAGPEALLALFMDMADVAEVYCDEAELRRVLRRIA